MRQKLPAARIRVAMAGIIPAFLLFFFFGLSTASAQNTFGYDSSFNSQIDTVFDSLNKSKVPFGILRDFAMEFTNL